MKRHRIALITAISFAFLLVTGCSTNHPSEKQGAPEKAASVEPFLGRWDLTLKSPTREYPSWLELSQTDGVLKANMVGRFGNAQPVPKVNINQGKLTFTAASKEEFEGTLANGMLSGSTTAPDGTALTWTGERAPALTRTGTPQWGKPVRLFNGKNLKGWHEQSLGNSPVTHHWKVLHGTLVSPGEGPEIVSDGKFEDFKLHLQFKRGPDSNSGVYLRGRYEVQIENESANEPPNRRTGSIYGFLAPAQEVPRTAGKWQTYDITLIGRKVSVVLNGKTLIDGQEIPGITGGALDSHEGEPGPIYLQGSEKGHVTFRDIVITPAVE